MPAGFDATEASTSVTASAPEVGKVQVKLTTQDLSLVLWYPQEKQSITDAVIPP